MWRRKKAQPHLLTPHHPKSPHPSHSPVHVLVHVLGSGPGPSLTESFSYPRAAQFRKAMFSKLYDTNTRMEKLKEMYVAEIYILRVQDVLNYHANGTMLRKQKAKVRIEVRTCCNKLLKDYTRVQLICTCVPVHVDVSTRCNKLLKNYWIPI